MRRFQRPATDLEAGMSGDRAVRYRRLALAEPDPEKAKLLRQIADEADRGVLVTSEWMTPAKFMGESPKAS
jgi:hypothetical protein